MATNLTDEIRDLEARAKQVVEDAQAEAARLVNEARDLAARKIKETRQSLYRSYREKTEALERNAEALASKILDDGKNEAQAFVREHESRIDEGARWVAEEVKKRYGRS